jgi:hypothetical protein
MSSTPSFLNLLGTRPRINNREIELLLAHFVRDPAFHGAASPYLTDKALGQIDEGMYRLVVTTARELVASSYPTGAIPYAAMYQRLGELASDEINGISQVDAFRLLATPEDCHEEGETPGLLYAIYNDLNETMLDTTMALTLLRRLLEERVVEAPLRDLVASAGVRSLEGLSPALQNLAEQSLAVKHLGSDPFRQAFAGEWIPTPIHKYPIGVDWIDQTMGGMADTDVNGLIGVYGGGKTLSGVQIATSCARTYLADHLREPEPGAERVPLRSAIFVSYEQPFEEIQHRFIAHMARIPKEKIEELADINQLSTSANLCEYEVEMYRERNITDPAAMLGERERIESAARYLGANIWILDMREPGRGMGGVPELAQYIHTHIRKTGIRPGVIVIDYCNAMAERELQGRGGAAATDDRALRRIVKSIPLKVKQQIAEPHSAAVWILQQFSGEANKRRPGAPMHGSDAGECRSFMENLVFCAALGVVEPHAKVLRIDISKARRGGVQGVHRICRFDGSLQEIKLAEDEFMLSDGVFVPRNVVNYFQGS